MSYIITGHFWVWKPALDTLSYPFLYKNVLKQMQCVTQFCDTSLFNGSNDTFLSAKALSCILENGSKYEVIKSISHHNEEGNNIFINTNIYSYSICNPFADTLNL